MKRFEPSQHCNINFNLHLDDKVTPSSFLFLHWPILLNFLEVCYGPLMLRCEQKKKIGSILHQSAIC